MKKKLLVVLGVLLVSSFSMAATANSSIESSLSKLEAQLERLASLEEQKFNEQKALAEAAQQRLENYRKMDSVIDSRIAEIEGNLDKVIFNKEFKDKVAEYKTLKAEIAKEIQKEEQVIEEFKLIESLR